MLTKFFMAQVIPPSWIFITGTSMSASQSSTVRGTQNVQACLVGHSGQHRPSTLRSIR